MDAYLGMIMAWPIARIPVGWALCDGTLLPINTNQALFSLLGILYGGDGRTTFGLPDLRGVVMLGAGQGKMGTVPLTNHPLAARGGAENVALSVTNLPAHTHTATVTGGGGSATVTVTPQGSKLAGNTTDATNNYVANANYPGGPTETGGDSMPPATCKTYIDRTSAGTSLVNMAPMNATVTVPPPTVTINPAGQGGPASIMQPYMALNFIICVDGLYPPFN